MTNDELDRLAAEKVMGWTYVKGEDGSETFGTEYGPIGTDCWQPTRLIENAWQLLDMMQKDFYSSCQDILMTSGEYRWCWRLQRRGIAHPSYFDTSAPTASEAIVRACLKAKGIEIKEGE